jgi:hypothetical protein
MVFMGDNISSPDQQRAGAVSAADLLRRHGALEALPDWNWIAVNPPSAKSPTKVFEKGTNDWNRFTLFESIVRLWMYFPDFAHITIVRPNATGKAYKRIPVNLLNSTNDLECSRDVPLEFGDVVEIPEREHTLAENDTQTDKTVREIIGCLRDKAGTAKLIVDGGQTIQLPLNDFESSNRCIHNLLGTNKARNVLTSDSDLSHVKVRRGGKTWTVDCSSGNFDFYSDLRVRDGDVIEVPERQ